MMTTKITKKKFEHFLNSLRQKNSESINQAQQWLDETYPQETRNKITRLDLYNKNLQGKLDLSSFPNLCEINITGNPQLRKLKYNGVTFITSGENQGQKFTNWGGYDCYFIAGSWNHLQKDQDEKNWWRDFCHNTNTYKGRKAYIIVETSNPQSENINQPWSCELNYNDWT